MRAEQILVTEVTITKAGQIKLFQIKLPKTAKRIIAVDTDIRLLQTLIGVPHPGVPGVIEPASDKGAVGSARELIPNLDFKPSQAVGELLLQSLEKANIFYSTIVRMDEANGGFGDASAGLFPASPYVNKGKMTPKKVNLNCNTTLIQAMFKDRFGAALKADVNYTLKVFVWVEMKSTNSKPEKQ